MNNTERHASFSLQTALGGLTKPPASIILAAQLLAGVTLAITLLAGIGWLTGSELMSAFGKTFYPMAPRTALVFLLYSAALFMTARNAASFRFASRILIAVGFILALTRIIEHLAGVEVGLVEQFLPTTVHQSVAVPAGRMALATAVCLVIGGGSLFLLIDTRRMKWRRYIGAGLAIGMIAVPLIFLLGYAYRAPLDYHGTAIPMALNTSIAFMTLGLGNMLLGIGYEVADKRNAMAATTFLAEMVKSSSDAIVGISMDDTILWWNDSAERLFGYTAQEAVGKSWSILALGDFYEQKKGNLDHLRRGGRPVNQEVVLRHKNGYAIDVDVSAFPLVDENGNVYAVAGINRDISQRKQLERERHASQSRLQAIMDNTAAIVFLKDLEGKFLMVNRQFEETLDVAPGSMVGKTDFDFFPHPIAERFRLRDLAVATAGSWASCEETLEMNEVTRTFLGNVFALIDDAGRSYGIGGIVTDITQRKEAENKISELNTALTRQTEALEAANKELESFSYSVSHDLRAPLRSVAGFSQVIEEDYAASLDERGKDYLMRVRTAADQMGTLIDDILSLSRVTRREMKHEWIDMSALALDVLTSLKRDAPKRSVAVEILPGLGGHGDKHLLRIVLENLLGNAWKYTGKRTDAHIDFGMTMKDGEEVFFVRDNGAGFDMQYAHKLFGAFQRLHHVDDFEGTGIGLATVQRIIRRHGGKIWADAQVDKGATFYFTLPRKEAAAYAETANIAR